jgi:hypothetical protein
MFRYLSAGLAAAVVIGSMVYAQEPASDSSAAPAAPAAQTVQVKQEQAPAPDTKSSNEQLTELKGKVDGLDEPLAAMKSTVDKLAKIKFSGYAYAQFRYTPDFMAATDTTKTGKKGADERTYGYSIGDFAGGAFPTRESSQFQLREARLKASYETDLSMVVFQIDVAPFTSTNAVTAVTTTTVNDTIKDSLGVNHIVPRTVTTATTPGAVVNGGGVTLKDAYYRFTEPWLKSFALKAGIFDRPFGFEIGYSSSSRETPERSRTEQMLFPNERDLGISLEYQPSDNLPEWARYFNFKGGLFTGDGINLEVDNNRDFIGRLGFSIPITDINLGIDLGGSLYKGTITDLSDSVYTTSNNAWVGTKGHLRETVDRTYYGGDMQIYFGNMPVLGGTCLRGELYTGKQPCFGNGSSKSYASNVVSTSAVYLRNFTGYYATLVQNIDPLSSQFVLRYDSYDPNTDLTTDNIKSLADVQFNTLGEGWIYHWDENVKFMLYDEWVMNEKCKNLTSSGYNFGGVLKNHILTFRIQYKF